MSPRSRSRVQLFRADGTDPKPISKREALSWSTRVREALRMFDVAVREGDVAALVEWAHEASGAAAELENIADTTRDAAAEFAHADDRMWS